MNQHDHDHEHDHALRDAYRRLSQATTTAVDPVPEVGRRMRRRRTTRRAVGGAVALALVGGVGVGAVLTRGGGDDLVAVDEPAASVGAAAQPSGPSSTLTFNHLDGTQYLFPVTSLGLSCEPAGGGKQTLTLTTRSPGVDPDDPDVLLEPLFYFDLTLDDAAAWPRTFALPFESADGSSDDRGMTIFFASPEGGKRANEVSSAENGTQGTVTVQDASCAGEPRLVLEVDATLGSELSQPAMAILGSYSS